MTRAKQLVRNHRVATTLVVLVVFSAMLVAALGVAKATDRPSFCGSACHEMAPFHLAWQRGAHSSVSCIDCHVDAGIPARLTHKVAAVKEVWAHYAQPVTFPLANPTIVPDERCRRCHDKITSSIKGFDHASHERGRSCVSCHAATGHLVTEQTLAKAGILNVALISRSEAATGFAVVDGGVANIPGHVRVSCSRCHDMAATGCSRCHEVNHEQGGATKTGPCHQCHSAGGGFAFTHPSGPDLDCTACHNRPEGHKTGACPTCHNAGVTWAFKHPRRAAVCTSCHAKPRGHQRGTCTGCHRKVGVSWAFTHPTSSACATCHDRPAGHQSGACTTCHRAGTSWAFTHSSSTACASCHDAPAGHYGTSCASCHAPTRAWRNAQFNHPRIPGGEHSYRSFACKSCHPSGYSSANCSKCHDSSGGGDDD
jgi:nitrate/TMAO reductase-like tetraheme cytochrome c subunit